MKAKWLALFGVLACNFFLTAKKINFITADLGRHLTNGRLLLQGVYDVWSKNLYSYTYPDFKFVNHHWGTGVLFYWIEGLFGFVGLSVFYDLLIAVTLLLFIRIATVRSNLNNALWAAFLVLPLLSYRTEIRPEGLSYFFLGVVYWILSDWKQGRKAGSMARHPLWLLPFVMMIWVNLHIYFFLGFFLMVVFWIDAWIEGALSSRKTLQTTLVVGLVSGAAACINPLGIELLFYPFHIFKNYGYPVLENQSVPFFLRRTDVPMPPLYPFFFLVALCFIGAVFVIWKSLKGGSKRKPLIPAVCAVLDVFPVTDWLPALVIGYMTWGAVRNFTLFGLFAIPLLARLFFLLLIQERAGPERRGLKRRGLKRRGETPGFSGVTRRLVLTASLLISLGTFWRDSPPMEHLVATFGFGKIDQLDRAAEFFKNYGLKGPLVNNYDNGGYLIYHLYPNEKVFVDNRPEAYPSTFFEDDYIPALNNEDHWKELNQKMSFNAIFFYSRDLTPWGQDLMRRRLEDPAWAPVYADGASLILLKRNEENRSLIARFELPKDIFHFGSPK